MEKRVNKYISLLFGLLVATSGCTDEFETENLRNDILLPGEYKFVLVNDAPQSRVSYENEISSVFETGDRIGVFAIDTNNSDNERQIQNEVFSARNMESNELIQVLAPPKGDVTQDLDTEIPDPGSQTPPPNYIFYFPMNEKWKLSDIKKGTGFSYNVESDQSTKENYQKSDFLWNYLTPDPDAAYQTVNMHHLMANIVVKIHKDSIDTSENPVTGKPKGITLKNMQTNATGISFESQQSGDMRYSVATNTKSDIEMYCQGTSGEYMIYRAAVPAWTTKKADEEIFTVTLYDRNGNSETVTYKLGEDLSMKDGHYYMFTLSSAVKPAIPDVGDDDSWVLDVFDPESGEIVGLLCREYLRYQPGNTSLSTPDVRTKRTDDGITISSQAWVFYNLIPGTTLPNLKEGTVLRFIYDIIGSNSHGVAGDAKSNSWPLPHHYGYDGVTAGGLFAARHGHEWVLNEEEKHGDSSKEYTDYYMHGGKIVWDKTTNDTGDFYHIGSFTIDDDLKIDNITAANFGHIAIPENGTPYVSYSPITENSQNKTSYDDHNCIIGKVVPHVLQDNRDGDDKKYPLVKIGYNNFWMSKSLRTKKMNNGQEVICRNSTPADGHDNWVDYDNANDFIETPSMLYPHSSALDVYSEHENPDKFPYLYSYYAVKDENFIPPSQDDRLTVIFPTEDLFNETLSYFGWRFAAKLMTSDVSLRSQASGGVLELETEKEALSNNKIFNSTYNSFACNISGFNLRTNGYRLPHVDWIGFGSECSLWLGDNFGKTEGKLKYLKFACYDVFKDSGFSAIVGESSLDQFPYIEGCSRVFLPVRLLLKFKGQEDSPAATQSIKNISKKSPGNQPRYTSQQSDSKIVNVRISKSAAEK